MADLATINTLGDIIRVHARRQPDRPLATFDDISATYGEVDTRSNRIAQKLREVGVSPGSRVAIVSTNRTEFFDVLFAVCKIGAVLLPVNWRLAPPELEYVLKDSATEVVFVGRNFVSSMQEVESAVGSLRAVVSLDAGTAYPSCDEWAAGAPDTDPGYESEAQEVVVQLYTSGTTGRPKGVLLTNRSCFAFYRNAREQISDDPEGVHLNCLPLFHVGGINWSLQGLYQGGHVVGSSEFDPDVTLGMIESLKVTHVMTVPTVIQLLLGRPAAATTDFSSVRVVIYGGSPIPERVLRQAIDTFGNVMHGLYGMTEMSFGATLLTPAEHVDPEHPERLLSVGRPFEGTDLKVVDVVTGEVTAEGEPGELWFRSPQMGSGYWNQPEESARTFTEDGWYRTGDIGRQVDGYFYVTDRLKDLIISGGENVYPAEIERALMEYDKVAEVVVFAVPHERWGESPRAEVVLVPGAEATEDELLDFVRARLARFKCPSAIGFRDELPKNASGKVLRHQLRAEFKDTAPAGA